MPPQPRPWVSRIPFPLLVAMLSALLLVGCGDDDGATASSPGAPTTPATAGATVDTSAVADDDPADPEDPPEGERPDRKGEGGSGEDAARTDAATEAQETYRAYIDAIDERDGDELCDLLSPAAVRELKPPVERASCAATLHDSIGYQDPRGFPVWERTSLNSIDGTQVSHDLDSARITAMITTTFADRDEPSVESDIAYLERAGGEWRLAKPSGALYRAVGNAELPPSVIVPPQG